MDLQIQFDSADLEALSCVQCAVELGTFMKGGKQDLDLGNELQSLL